MEPDTVVTSGGIFTVFLGAKTPLTVVHFDSSGLAWLSTEVASDVEATPRTRVTSVPYAYQAGNADKLDGYDAADFLASPRVDSVPFRAFGIVPTDPTRVVISGASPALRRITSITVQLGGIVEVYIGSSQVLKVQGSFLWTSNGGAPIEVQPGEDIEARQTSAAEQASVLIVGWEY
jgi:hypothetical protein